MITLSPGYLYASFKLLELISNHKYDISTFGNNFRRIESLSTTDVVNFSMKMGWLELDDQKKVILTPSGAHIHSLTNAPKRICHALLDFIGIAQPSWAHLIPRGRQETISILPSEVRQCFSEAGLVKGYSDEIISWWDALAMKARGQRSKIQLDIGRKGEKLSLEYEKARTNKTPKWQSIESNLSGYDILSIVNDSDEKKLQIEVKSTLEEIDYGSFFVTKNEWECALLADHYKFHLWALGEKNTCLLCWIK